MNIQEMQDVVVRTLGHENEWTIWFFSICEKLTFEETEKAFVALMSMNFFLSEKIGD